MMTIPTRPAPAPPVTQTQNAAAGANDSIEQLRRQLEQQQRQQQQNGGSGMQKLTIKLPPPPKGTAGGSSLQTRNINCTNNNNTHDTFEGSGGNASSITRKFPKARYAPATNWDDSPFEMTGTAAMNGNVKKMPPPRPPPPKVQVNGKIHNRLNVPPNNNSGHPAKILTNLFQRKKNNSRTTTNAAGTQLSRNYSINSNNSSNGSSHFVQSSSYSSNSSTNWNSNWSTINGHSTTTSTAFSSIQQQSVHEAQLISFDSPPSSPTFTQKSNSDCVSVDSFSSDSNFSSPHNGSVSQPESGFEDDFNSRARSRPATTSPLDPWETVDAFTVDGSIYGSNSGTTSIGTAPVRNLNAINTRLQANNDNPLCNGKSLLPPPTSLTAPTIIKPKISQKPKAPKPPLLPKPHYGGSVTNDDLPTPPSPPMPQCAPPPLPAVNLLDVITGKVDALQLGSGDYCQEEISQPYGIALYDFEGVEVDDLSFRENDKIYLLEQVSEEWYRGRTRTGCEGIFPANYIEVKVPLNTISSHNNYQQTVNTPSISSGYRPTKCRCLYNFPAEVEGDLALNENDVVNVLYRINEDWLYGECNGKQGQFPANFLDDIPKNIPMP